MSDFPQHNDYDNPPVGEREPEARYRSIYWSPSNWSGRNNGRNSWWDGYEHEDPEKVREYMEKHRPGKEYVILKLTTTVEVVDTSQMGYDDDHPLHGLKLES